MAWQQLAAQIAADAATSDGKGKNGGGGGGGVKGQLKQGPRRYTGEGSTGGGGGSGGEGGLLGIRGGPIASSASSIGDTTFSPRTPINVQPVGVNIGEILKGPNSGAATNGGQPLSAELGRPSNYRTSTGAQILPAQSEGQTRSNNLVLLAGLAAGGGLLAWMIAR